ncbi:chloride channel protein 2 [Platysternon megacephalum]|uniref:Chloride channel protein 2 n=1 Tax=Platysternon megacephalum TaxID=55544 RepID=A0A4D9E0H2_9SAUR|nr:chloride channel protein 2 [Platysternon megacephalum]
MEPQTVRSGCHSKVQEEESQHTARAWVLLIRETGLGASPAAQALVIVKANVPVQCGGAFRVLPLWLAPMGYDSQRSYEPRSHFNAVALGSEVDCSKYPRGTSEDGKVLTACPFILADVCGTDGVTYPSECGLCAHNSEHGTNVSKKHDGKCQRKIVPLDCSQYPSAKAEDGQVLTPCPRILAEVCGTDGVTYPNDCMLCAHNLEHGTNVSKKHDERCKWDVVPKLQQLEAQSGEVTRGHHCDCWTLRLQVDCNKYRRITTEDGKVLTACPLILAEVCGTDGITYPSECELCAHNL